MYGQGYRTENGNYITKAEVQQRKKKRLNEIKEIRKQREIDMKKETDYKTALYMQEIKESKLLEEESLKRVNQKDNFIKYASENFEYASYIVAYDMACNSYHYVIKSIRDKKVTIERVKEIYNVACNMIDSLSFNIESVTI